MLELRSVCVLRDHARKIKLYYSLYIKRGEQVLITGPSGAGKSTLLLLISGLLLADSGEILIDSVAMSPKELISKVSILFQDDNLFAHLSVYENMALGIDSSSGKIDKKGRRDAIQSIANSLGISEILESGLYEISGGQRQRVGLARALLQEREILLLDEPFSSLQPQLRAELLSLTRSLCYERGITLLIVSHDDVALERTITICADALTN